MPHVFKRAAAIRDLVEHYVYLEEQAGEAVAERFLANAESSFVALSEHPEMGGAHDAVALSSPRCAIGAFETLTTF
jgi:plasmid stabilization system protein ParE